MYIKKIMIASQNYVDFIKSRKELIDLFLSKNFLVYLVSPPAKNRTLGHDFLKKNNKIKHFELDLSRNGYNPFVDISTLKKFSKIISENKPDVIYSFGGSKITMMSMYLGKKNKISTYCTINGLGSILRSHSIKFSVLKNIMIILYKITLKNVSGILFQNPDDLEYFKRNKIIKNEKTVIVNGSGVNLEKFIFSEIENYNIFLYVGRLIKDKGINEFLKASKILKKENSELEFWIIGDLDSNPTSINFNEIEKLVNNGIIKYFGHRDDVSKFYKESTVFVMPSYHEGIPRVTLEAMASGRPIITTDTYGCKETVVENYNGFLVPVGNYYELAEKMRQIIYDKDLIDSMGKNSFKLSKKKFDVKNINENIYNFIVDDFINKKGTF